MLRSEDMNLLVFYINKNTLKKTLNVIGNEKIIHFIDLNTQLKTDQMHFSKYVREVEKCFSRLKFLEEETEEIQWEEVKCMPFHSDSDVQKRDKFSKIKDIGAKAGVDISENLYFYNEIGCNFLLMNGDEDEYGGIGKGYNTDTNFQEVQSDVKKHYERYIHLKEIKKDTIKRIRKITEDACILEHILRYLPDSSSPDECKINLDFVCCSVDKDKANVVERVLNSGLRNNLLITRITHRLDFSTGKSKLNKTFDFYDDEEDVDEINGHFRARAGGLSNNSAFYEEGSNDRNYKILRDTNLSRGSGEDIDVTEGFKAKMGSNNSFYNELKAPNEFSRRSDGSSNNIYSRSEQVISRTDFENLNRQNSNDNVFENLKREQEEKEVDFEIDLGFISIFIILAHGSTALEKVKYILNSLGGRTLDQPAIEGGTLSLNMKLKQLGKIYKTNELTLRNELLLIKGKLMGWKREAIKELRIYQTMNMFKYKQDLESVLAQGWVLESQMEVLDKIVQFINKKFGHVSYQIIKGYRKGDMDTSELEKKQNESFNIANKNKEKSEANKENIEIKGNSFIDGFSDDQTVNETQKENSFDMGSVNSLSTMKEDNMNIITTEHSEFLNFEIPENPPTYIKTNKLTHAFQMLCNVYGVPRYKELNPAVFYVTTFPFMFGVMFGDFLHGMMLLVMSVYLIKKEKHIKIPEYLEIVFQGRYIMLLCSFWCVFFGILYSDLASTPLAFFPSAFEKNESNVTVSDKSYTYPFGIDYMWHKSEKNGMAFFNSIKMKLSIVLGFCHMTIGIILNYLNAFYRKDMLGIYCTLLPQSLAFFSFIGYMVFLIYYKWLFLETNISIITILVNMFTQPFKLETSIYDRQFAVQLFLMFNIVISFPWMLMSGPIVEIYKRRKKSKNKEHLTVFLEQVEYEKSKKTKTDDETGEKIEKFNVHGLQDTGKNNEKVQIFKNEEKITKVHENIEKSNDIQNKKGVVIDKLASYNFHGKVDSDLKDVNLEVLNKANNVIEDSFLSNSKDSSTELIQEKKLLKKQIHDDTEEEGMMNVWMHYCIEGIEFGIGLISNISSYLRLWAISLAHSQLTHVLHSFTIGSNSNLFVRVATSPIYLFFTFAILIGLEGLSSCLHALRLNWIEFNARFYKGDGYAFIPMNFEEGEENNE